MPTTLSLQEHLAGAHQAVAACARLASAAGLDVPVPTCPGWSVRRLIGHLGASHRWTVAALRGEDLDAEARRRVEKTGRSSRDPVDWLRSGAITTFAALARAPEDLSLPMPNSMPDSVPDSIPGLWPDAPAPRVFLARRMHHESTIHAADALAAGLQRIPGAEEAAIALDLTSARARDGLDELLLGRVPRPTSPPRFPIPQRLIVRATDVDLAWVVEVSNDAPRVSVPGPPVCPDQVSKATPPASGPARRPPPQEPDAPGSSSERTRDRDLDEPRGETVPDHEQQRSLDALRIEAEARHLYLALWHRAVLRAPIWPLWPRSVVPH